MRPAAVNLARDICLRLIEHRGLAPEQLPWALGFLARAAENLMAAEAGGPEGLYPARLARDMTLKLIERNLSATVEGAAESLAENWRLVRRAAEGLPPASAPAALAAARDLALKFLETGRLARADWPDMFLRLARVAAGLPEEKP
ncbi:MAG: hypothetical protein LBV70_06580 [Candidatus Adiutrix sp.]|nr:hypothetical protein [Candidatus Adiutrix sp.]